MESVFVLAEWYCGCLAILLDIDLKNIQRDNGCWGRVRTLGFEEGSRATEVSTALASSANEWSDDLGVCVAFMDMKQALDNVTPPNLSGTVKKLAAGCDSG